MTKGEFAEFGCGIVLGLCGGALFGPLGSVIGFVLGVLLVRVTSRPRPFSKS